MVDVAMPGMNGVEFIRRARERRPGLPAVLVTGYADVAAFAPAAGDLVFQKPYRLERLAEKVVEALRRELPQPGSSQSGSSQSGSNVITIKPAPRRA